ncbi:hypothetical protein AAY473_033020 [Plecturocebus cupreus]
MATLARRPQSWIGMEPARAGPARGRDYRRFRRRSEWAEPETLRICGWSARGGRGLAARCGGGAHCAAFRVGLSAGERARTQHRRRSSYGPARPWAPRRTSTSLEPGRRRWAGAGGKDRSEDLLAALRAGAGAGDRRAAVILFTRRLCAVRGRECSRKSRGNPGFLYLLPVLPAAPRACILWREAGDCSSFPGPGPGPFGRAGSAEHPSPQFRGGDGPFVVIRSVYTSLSVPGRPSTPGDFGSQVPAWGLCAGVGAAQVL